MRWQKIARFAIAVFVVGFGAFVFLAMRQRVAAPPGGEDVGRSIPRLVLESGAGERKSCKFGKLDFDLKYDKALTYKDGRSKLVGVTLTLPDRNGRTFIVTADEGELVAPPDKPSRRSSVAKLTGNVKLTTDNGVEVLGQRSDLQRQGRHRRRPGPGRRSRAAG